MIHIAALGVDSGTLVQTLKDTVERKRRDGAYVKAGLDDESLGSPLAGGDNAAFLTSYMEHLRANVFVDITDFDIKERRTQFRRPLVKIKKAIWGMLRFYTYRLWSQQNEINALLLAAAEGIHDQQRKHITQLEARVSELEKASGNQALDVDSDT